MYFICYVIRKLFGVRQYVSMRSVNDYHQNTVSLNNNYTKDELVMLWYIHYISSSTSFNVPSEIPHEYLRDAKILFNVVFKCGNNYRIKLHGIIKNKNDETQYVFKLNGKYVCRDSFLEYCDIGQNYYSVYNGTRIYYGHKYMIIQEYLGDKANPIYVGGIDIHVASYCKYEDGISIPNTYSTNKIISIVYKTPTNFDFERTEKLLTQSPKLFKKLYNQYKINI